MLCVGLGEGDPCNPQRPWTVRLQGPEVVSGNPARHSLVFTPDFPCGVERGQTFAPPDDIPLRVIARWSGCIGEDRPGDMVLVRGHVAAIQRVLAVPVANRPAQHVSECEGISTYPRVKLALHSCRWVGPAIIDADSQVVVPAGELRIDVLAPGPSLPAGADFGVDPWVEGTARVAGSSPEWIDLTLRVSACPLRCCWCPYGQLTEYLFTIDDPGASFRTLIRPRRARRLEISPTLATVTVAWLRDTTATLPIFGQTVFSTGVAVGPPTIDLVGAAPAIAQGASVGTNTSYIRWEIQ